ncbi:hypothetical protein PDESU_04828 [Pontiella desulfatans]|uniref:Uncharacterized protein n=1 Tax=Pontiella desulfatans TaxID=2750659 RepID=A0A6C2U938_PONDE|nr:hypothetical protein [Pontiella desulfatans]VGO16237.1 hypothetical protein PDESU_04828 [Pontiella desulfatans]
MKNFATIAALMLISAGVLFAEINMPTVHGTVARPVCSDMGLGEGWRIRQKQQAKTPNA